MMTMRALKALKMIGFRVDPKVLEMIDQRAAAADVDRSEMVRRLLLLGLTISDQEPGSFRRWGS